MPSDAEAMKRRLIAEADLLQPFDRDLRRKAESLRAEWKRAGRSGVPGLDDELWKMFNGTLNDAFAARIPVSRSGDDVRVLARQLAGEWASSRSHWLHATNEAHVVEKRGLLRSTEEHVVTKNVLFEGYCFYSRKVHEGAFLRPHSGDALSMTFEKSLELWLRRDGTIIAVEATETGLFPSNTWWTARTASVATDHHLHDSDYLFRKRRLTGPNTRDEFMYEFEKWKDGAHWRIGLRLRDLLYNTRRNRAT